LGCAKPSVCPNTYGSEAASDVVAFQINSVVNIEDHTDVANHRNSWSPVMNTAAS